MMARVGNCHRDGDAEGDESDEYGEHEECSPRQPVDQVTEAVRADGCSYAAQGNQSSSHISSQRYDETYRTSSHRGVR